MQNKPFTLRFRAAFIHLLCSGLVAGIVAALVFGVWFPWPYAELTGGNTLFLILVAVDGVCGPLLTLVVFNPAKPKAELVRDLIIIAFLQLAALGYGVSSMYEARPVYLAYEGDRFRVVTAAEIDYPAMDKAPIELQKLSLTGPRLLGVKLLENTDPEYLSSLSLAMEGLHPSMRPERWVPYKDTVTDLSQSMKPLLQLKEHSATEEWQLVEEALVDSDLVVAEVGYLPMVSRYSDTWVVLLSRKDARPIGFAPINGWGED